MKKAEIHSLLSLARNAASWWPGLLLALTLAGLFIIWIGRKPDIDSFEQAKYYLETEVFHDHPYTLYCNARYDEDKNIIPSAEFSLRRNSRRSRRMEWEHVVPVEKFGRNFPQWHKGDPDCVSKGVKFYGRKCVRQVNAEFRKIEADMYNIYPAIGAVNATRGKKDYAFLPEGREEFGQCGVRVMPGKFEPPDRVKGIAARASLYMNEKYSQVRLSSAQIEMFENWSRQFPVDEWECRRARRIKKLQGNANRFVEEGCGKIGR